MWEQGSVGARLARDAGNSVHQANRGDAIAGKPCSHTRPAPTQARSHRKASLRCSTESASSEVF
ncbi:hypothetical protein B1219_03825 [Pseudomonas ogarae]|nr:hypothetical protein B1219_03825 [Pseudomonas ogarae]OPG76342.1 hypothetical protein B1218_26615 [Pseudomonas ogarae]